MDNLRDKESRSEGKESITEKESITDISSQIWNVRNILAFSEQVMDQNKNLSLQAQNHTIYSNANNQKSTKYENIDSSSSLDGVLAMLMHLLNSIAIIFGTLQ